MAGCYRKFVKGFGLLSKPLTDLLKKGIVCWASKTEASLQALKQAHMTSLVLALLDFSKTFELEIDASNKGIRE